MVVRKLGDVDSLRSYLIAAVLGKQEMNKNDLQAVKRRLRKLPPEQVQQLMQACQDVLAEKEADGVPLVARMDDPVDHDTEFMLQIDPLRRPLNPTDFAHTVPPSKRWH